MPTPRLPLRLLPRTPARTRARATRDSLHEHGRATLREDLAPIRHARHRSKTTGHAVNRRPRHRSPRSTARTRAGPPPGRADETHLLPSARPTTSGGAAHRTQGCRSRPGHPSRRNGSSAPNRRALRRQGGGGSELRREYRQRTAAALQASWRLAFWIGRRGVSTTAAQVQELVPERRDQAPSIRMRPASQAHIAVSVNAPTTKARKRLGTSFEPVWT